jgi:hypothetical protein
MLYAQRRGALKYTYGIVDEDSKLIAFWNPKAFQNGGEFELLGTRYTVQTAGWAQQRATLIAGDGTVLAEADGVGRKRWTVRAGDEEHHFERASIWRADQALVNPGRQRIGLIRRVGFWGQRAQADLPGLPQPIAVFALVLALLLWERDDGAAAAAAT